MLNNNLSIQMAIQSYQSKIIHPLQGSFPTVHDYLRLDLDESNSTFKLHRYYIKDGGGHQYTRSGGTYEMCPNQPEGKAGKIKFLAAASHMIDVHKLCAVT